jgi:hypothetical protein
MMEEIKHIGIEEVREPLQNDQTPFGWKGGGRDENEREKRSVCKLDW